MKMNKIFAAMAASAVAASAFAAMSINSFAAADEYPESVTIMLAGGWGGVQLGWTNADAKAENSVTITENGTYTITVDSSEGGEQGNSTWAMALRTTDFVAFDYGDEGDEFEDCIQKAGIKFTVDSVKISGVEKLNGTPSELVKDDDGSNMRVNIYNKWGNNYAIVDDDQNFDGDVEVTFTVSGLKFGAQGGGEDTDPTDPTETTTTTGSGEATTTTTTSGSGAAGTTTTAAKTGEGSAKTGDAGVAVAVAALGLAAATAFVVRKKD